MQKIDRDRLDENTGQIECGEEIGTVFLIDKETAITVKHCLLIEKPETYAKNAVLHFSVKDEEKTVNATVISEDNDSSEDLVVLRCEESIDVQPLYLFSAELDVFDELQMVGYGKSFGFEKRWIQLKNTNLLKKTNKNMILDTIDSAAMDYEGFSGSLIADYNNCIVGIANMQNTEKGKANSLLGISVKNRKKFFENNNIPVYDRAALLNAHCKATKAKAFQNGIDQNVYLKNKQLENDTNSRNIEENTNPLLNMSNVYSEDYNWNIKYTRIEEQEVAFGELLWSKLNEDTQLPDLEQYYFFVFMKWPHPEEIDPLERIKKSFISEKVSSKWKEDIRGRNFTEISYWEQLAVWNRYYVDEWSAKEKEWFLELFIGCCSDMVKYWKESKFDFQFTFSKWHMKMMIRAIASFGRNGWKGVNPVQSKKLCTLLKEFYDEGIYSWEVEAMFLADEKVPAFMNEMLELMYETESDMVFSATMAVEKCLETIMDQQLKENTLLELFNLIKARKEPGLEYFLMIIHNIFYRTNSRFPSKIMKGVSQVLRLVEKYTRINFQISTQEEFKENIKVRKQCATLAFLVYRFENTFYEGQHCPEVEEWKNICTGEKAENEFAEVKNCWLLPEL